MTYEQVSFTDEWVMRFTLEEFINHKGVQHLWPRISPEDRMKRLSEVYDLISYANGKQHAPVSAEDKPTASH